MQSGGQGAGIQLQVGLDLAYFRTKLVDLQAVTTGTKLSFGVAFKRLDIQNELNALATNIKKRNYFLEVKTNLAAEIKNAQTLATALDNLARSSAAAKTSVGQRLGVGALGRAPSQGGLGVKDVEKIYRASAQAGLLAFDKEIAKSKASMVAALEVVGIDSITGLLNGLSSQDARLRAAAEYLGEILIKTTKTSLGIASPSKEFEKIGKNVGEGFEKGALSSMDQAFDALERQLQARLRKLQGMMQPSVSRRGAFPFVAKTGPIESQALMSESVALAQQLDQARAQIAQIQQRREGRLSFERASLSQSAGRMLPAGRSAVPMASAQELVVKSFYANMRNGSRMLRENFSANSYFPKATKALASAMDEATSGMKALPGARGPIAALPSAEMLDRRRFQSAMERAAQIDAQNAARQQTARTNATMQMRQQLSALPPLTAPSIGGGNAPLSRAGAYSLNKANQLLGLPIGPSSPLGSMGQFPMSGMMGRGSMGQFPMDPMLAIGGASAMGQKVAGPYPWSNTVASARGGYTRGVPSSAFFPMSGMMGPSSPLGSITPQSSMFAGGGGGAPPRPPSGGGGGMGGFGRALGGINLPGTGVVREIGNEFAMATKQVLLFGTAYKALAFITSFPAQVGQAVGALQSFNNTLKAISPTADEARASNQFILDIVDRYNVPLQSARDGFTNLYASMAPAGFSGNEIRELFTGVSQAAATFGMSADKVDRVNYAFAQMASKGQVMSEELKGQLGDVLPGAMGIFAKAAGFEGPSAIQKFSKALEDGEYKGKAMRDLLKNVTTELKKEFGPGAEGAAKTFQGAINRMQNSTKLLYEAFEPAAVGFLNSVVVPLTGGLKTITEGVRAYFQGQKAATPEAENFNNVLKTLVPSLSGIAQNVGFALQQLLPLGQVLGAVILQITRFLALPLVGYLASTYLQVVLLTSGFKLLATSGVGLALVSIARFVAQGAIAASVMLKLQVATQQTTVATYLFGQAIQTVMIKSVVGIALVAISTLISKIMELRGQLSAIGNDAKGMEDLAKASARMGDVSGTKEAIGNIKDRLATFKELQRQLKDAKKTSSGSMFDDRGAISESYEISTDLARKLVELGVVSAKALTKTSGGYSLLADNMDTVNALVNKNVDQFTKAGQKGNILVDQAIRKNKELKAQVEQPGGEEDEDGKKVSLESYYSLQDQLAKAQTQAEIDRIQGEFDHKFKLLNSYYDLQNARANSFQKLTIAFQKELLAIEQERQQSAMAAQVEVLKAQGSVAGGVQGVSVSGSTGLFQGSTGVSSAPHFDVRRQDGSYISPDQARALFDPSVRRQLSMTSAYGPRRAPVPGASTFHRGVDLAGPANTPLNLAPGFTMVGTGEKGGLGYAASVRGPAGEMYDVGHLQRPTAGAPRKVPGSEKRDILAEQQAAIALRNESVVSLQAEEVAAEKTAVAIANYVASIAPVAEQELQNTLLAKRIELMDSGVTGEFLETQIKIFEAEEKTRIAGKMLDETNKAQVEGYKKLKEALPGYVASLQAAAVAQQDLNFATAKSELAKRKAMAGALTADAELRVELAQKYPGNLAKQEEEFAETKLVQGMEKTKQDLQNIASSIGDAFGTAFKGIITGSSSVREALAGMFQSIADSFADMVAKMIAEWLKAQLIQGFANIFSAIVPGIAGIGGGGLSSGFSAGASSAIDTSAAGWGAAFNTPLKFANGGIASGGFRAFANGGIVTGPTLGLVGEGRYNEAVIPLPDGKSVPVDLGGGAGSQITSNIVINVSSDGKTSSSGADSVGLGRKIEGAVKQVIVEELRPGGVLAGRR
jgi:tape measure domain-containing protein